MKLIIILLLCAIVLFCCKKKANSINSNPDIDLTYAAKYTPKMSGTRLWHRHATYFVIASGRDTTINLTDTTLRLVVYNDTTIAFNFGSGYVGIPLISTAGGMLRFYAIEYDLYNHPSASYGALYFPLNDSISLGTGPAAPPKSAHPRLDFDSP